MEILLSLLGSQIGGYVAGALAVLAGLWAVYSKGKSAQKAKDQTADLRNANEILKGAADARDAAARRDADAKRLRADDGFRRKNK